MSEVSLRHLESQACHCADSVIEVLCQTLLGRHPADRSLSSHFYNHREYGSRDRRLISETLFSVLRWWGWLQKIAPEQFTAAWRERKESAPILSHEKFYAVFGASWLLEGNFRPPAAVQWWLSRVGIDLERITLFEPDSPLAERACIMKPFRSGVFTPSELLPAWALEKIDPAVSRELLEDWFQERPPVWLRIHSHEPKAVYDELQEASFHVERHPGLSHAWKITATGGGNLRALKSFHEGAFEIQDAASQTVAAVCNPKPGQQWWDACAGGGGKTLHLASLMNCKGSVLATDIRLHKLEDLKLRARRAQFPNIRCKEWQGKPFPAYYDHFDGVLVDTPCSCSGTWRRNPDARWTTYPEEIPEFHALQLQLLTNASRCVKPGGTLVYSTCSMFQEENAQVVTEFLANHPDYELVDFRCPLTGRETGGMNQMWPWDADCDAMFEAKMTRKAK